MLINTSPNHLPKGISVKSTAPQVISATECYTISEFRKRTGLGDFSFRKVRAAGLPIVEVGKKRFVRGKDWLVFLDLQAAIGSQSSVNASVNENALPGETAA